MELVNQTPLAAEVHVSKTLSGDGTTRRGILVAKATFSVGRDGVTLVEADPFPIEPEDVETELGIMPADIHLRTGTALEVGVLGAAYAPFNRPVAEMDVEMKIGDRSWTLHVTGDRQWIGTGAEARPSAPAPFVRLPLSWDRAYGGRTDVWIDQTTVIEAFEPANPFGRGFDPEPQARALGGLFGGPDGFPWWERTRLLPNLEHPSQRIETYRDAPAPYCWAPRPLQMTRPASPHQELERLVQTGTNVAHEGLIRALPALVLPQAPLGQEVKLTGMRPSGDWTFILPRAGVVADYVLGQRGGYRPLVPQALVLLPEQARFYLVFRTDFWMKAEQDDERSFRLRLVEAV
jgi:hypothetical protein